MKLAGGIATMGKSTPGAWCIHCLVSSAYEVEIVVLWPGGVSPLGAVIYCPDCDEWELPEGERGGQP